MISLRKSDRSNRKDCGTRDSRNSTGGGGGSGVGAMLDDSGARGNESGGGGAMTDGDGARGSGGGGGGATFDDDCVGGAACDAVIVLDSVVDSESELVTNIPVVGKVVVVAFLFECFGLRVVVDTI